MSALSELTVDEATECALRKDLSHRLVSQRHAAVGGAQRDLLVLESRLFCRSLPARVLRWLGTSGIAFIGDSQTLLMLRITFGRLQLFSEFTAEGELFAADEALPRLDRLSLGLRLKPIRELVQPVK